MKTSSQRLTWRSAKRRTARSFLDDAEQLRVAAARAPDWRPSADDENYAVRFLARVRAANERAPSNKSCQNGSAPPPPPPPVGGGAPAGAGGGATTTVSVAEVLVTVPAEFVITTEYVAPLSEAIVSAGVVYEADVAPEISVPLRRH